MTATFALSLLLAVIGFERLLTSWGRPMTFWCRLDACLLGSLYIVAPFTLIYINNGVFWAINIALSIGILPLFFHFFLRCFIEGTNQFELPSIAGLSLCLIVIGWSILFIFPTLLIMTALLLMRGRLSTTDMKKILVVASLLFLGSLASLYGLYLSAIDAGWRFATDPVTSNAAYRSIQGGVLTGFLQHALWLIYTPWTPRLVMGFTSHFHSPIYIVLTILLLLMAIALPLLDNRGPVMRRYLNSVLMLLVVVFFAKAAGQPFGFVFEAILANVPGAGLIRTPDTKFGAFVILALAAAVTLALAGTDLRLSWVRFASRLVIVGFVSYHAVPLINGQAILAIDSQLVENRSGKGYAVAPTAAERLVVKSLREESAAGVVVLPPAFGTATKRDGGIFTYRNVIAEFASNAFYYSDWNEAPSPGLMGHLKAAVEQGNWRVLSDMGIGFVLVNNNVLNDRASHRELYPAIKNAPEAWVKTIDEGGYELYRLVDTFRRPLLVVSTPRGGRAASGRSRSHWFGFFDPGP